MISCTFTLHPTALRIWSTSYRSHGNENDAAADAAACYGYERGVTGCGAEVASGRQTTIFVTKTHHCRNYD